MYQLRCTKKVQDALGLKPADLIEVQDENFTIGNWYVNLFTADCRKCLVFMEEQTLMSFILVGYRKEHAKDIGKIFKNGVLQLLELEGFPSEIIEAYEKAPENVLFTKTASKKLLGNMKDVLSGYEHFIYMDGGLKHCDFTDAMLRINRTPQRTLKWKFPIESLHQLFGTAT
ncbi:hypothetical protein E5T98_22675 [Vibrio vulnificus]|nr:hypothetical protein [Vibrio vulnificus]EIJ0948518.1 hypothetical protein [Vibrio vulnificus]EJD0676964.1 hypothetical protein [Vibrio vulnificus]EJZ7973419.1 hypothetical protein [Vibrio vulnificus]